MVKENERFFDSFSYSEAEFAEYMSRLHGTGVERFKLGELAVSPTGTMNIQVQPGEAFVDGFYYRQPDPIELAINQESLEDYRIDYVVIRVERNLNRFRLLILEGVPGEDPPDDLLLRNTSYYDIVICMITVTQGASQITTGMLTDTRSDALLCGYSGVGVAPDPLTALSIDRPGMAFASNPYSGFGWDSANSGIVAYVNGQKPMRFLSNSTAFVAPIIHHGAPELGSTWQASPPPAMLHENAGIYSWDRRFQDFWARSRIVSGERQLYQGWGWRIGTSSDGDGAGALELFDVNIYSLPGSDTGNTVVRPETSRVAIAFDVNGRIFLNRPTGATSAGPGFPHRVTISEPYVNASGLMVDNLSGLFSVGDVARIMLVPQIGAKPGGSGSEYPAKRHSLAPDARKFAGLLYSNSNGPLQGLVIGPDGGTKGIVIDQSGRVGINLTPSIYDFDVMGSSMFRGGMSIDGGLNISSASTGSPSIFAQREVQFYGGGWFGDTLNLGSAYDLANGAPVDGHVYGDWYVHGALHFGDGGGDEIEFNDVNIQGDLDVYGFVRFHKSASENPWSFDVTGNQHIAGKLDVGSSGRFAEVFLGSGTNYRVSRVSTIEVWGGSGVALFNAGTGRSCSWQGDNWHSTQDGGLNQSIGNLGSDGAGASDSRWGRAYLIWGVDISQPSGLFQMELAQAAGEPVETEDGTPMMAMRRGGEEVLVEPPRAVSRIRGMETFTPGEALNLVNQVRAVKFFQPMHLLEGATEIDRAAALRASRELRINALDADMPPELSPQGAGLDPLKLSLTGLIAMQALHAENTSLRSEVSDLRAMVEALAARLPAQ